MKRIRKITKRLLLTLLVLTVVTSLSTILYMKQTKFGRLPEGSRLERVTHSPNYKEGRFRNQVPLPTITEGYSIWKEVYKTFFRSNPRKKPGQPLPSVKTDLKNLPVDSNLLVWFGHSSFYMQVGGKRILVDPVFSGNASPIPGSVKAFKGTDIYTAEDMPEINYLFISHDHYDHLDYTTITGLRPKVKKVICGLGVGAHFEYWGYERGQITEADWYDVLHLDKDFTMHILPTHHDGGRGFKQGQSLWISFLLEAPGLKIFYSGDGGYDPVFHEIGKQYGPVDLAIMECGQYNEAWRAVHKLPEEVRLATIDIGARRMLPVHHSKFSLARHDWDEPLKKMKLLAKDAPYLLATPMIGEPLYLNQEQQVFKDWWLGIK